MISFSGIMHGVEFFAKCGVEVGALGASEDGRLIPYIFIGKKDAPAVFITAGIHAREHVSSYLVMRQAEHALNHYNNLNACEQKKFGGIYFMPTLNPDGLEICRKGVRALKKCDKRFVANLIKQSGKERGFYKANALGVDLNVNFDAKWGTGASNVFTASIENFVGTAPFSAAETRCIRDFTLIHRPIATVSYHSLGRELYWQFGQNSKNEKRDFDIAKYLNKKLKYAILPDSGTSAGGYKDWCISNLSIPSFTIELGSDTLSHPVVDYSLLKHDIKVNIDLPIKLLNYLTH